MVTINISLVVGILSILGTLGGVIAMCFKLFKRFDTLEQDAKTRRENDRVMFRALFACLDGLKQLNCNGKVTEAYNELRDELIDHNK